MRYCIIAVLLTAALVMIFSPAFASDNSQITVITSQACASENTLKGLTVSSAATVFAASLLAGFNPCLLAMLAFLASSMLASSGRRRDILTMVAFFSLGTFVVYIILGVGLFSVLREKSTATMFRSVPAAVLLVLGLMQMEDARRLQSGGTSLFRTDWTNKYVQGVISSRSVSSYFLLGALFSLVRAPCVGGIYIAIIGMISSQEFASSGPIYLMIYNLGHSTSGSSPGRNHSTRHEPRASGSFPEQTQSCHPGNNGNHAIGSGIDHILANDLIHAIHLFSLT